MSLTISGTIPEGQHATISARCVGPSGQLLTGDDVSTWGLSIFDQNSLLPNTPVYSIAGQTTPIIGELLDWSEDSEGYNFSYRVERGLFGCTGGHVYLMVWAIDTFTYGLVVVSASVSVRPASRS